MTHRELMETFHSVLGTSIPRMDIPRWALPIFAEMIGLLNRLRVSLPINREALLMGGRYLYYDNAKAVKELGLQTRPFIESVCDAYRWYAEHGYFEKRGIPVSKLPALDDIAC
jgi:hypothetical protein